MTTKRTTPIATGTDGVEAQAAGTIVNPTLDGFVFETGALNILAAIVGVREIANVVTIDTTLSVDLDNVSVVLVNWLVFCQNFSTV